MGREKRRENKYMVMIPGVACVTSLLRHFLLHEVSL